jgi:hypothetical protein
MGYDDGSASKDSYCISLPIGPFENRRTVYGHTNTVVSHCLLALRRKKNIKGDALRAKLTKKGMRYEQIVAHPLLL